MKKLYFITLLLSFFATGKILANDAGLLAFVPKVLNDRWAPIITVGPVIGRISACVGSPAASPNIQQFTVTGSNLTTDITLTAPTGFEISVNAAGGYANTLTLTQSAGIINNTIIYARSAASDAVGNISGSIIVSSSGIGDTYVVVSGAVNALPVVNALTDQTVTNGNSTSAVAFSGNANIYTWTNNTPSIGLPASGTGDISSFTAINNGNTPITATITATPGTVPIAYIPIYSSPSVAILNTQTNTVQGTISAGNSPFDIVPSPDGS